MDESMLIGVSVTVQNDEKPDKIAEEEHH